MEGAHLPHVVHVGSRYWPLNPNQTPTFNKNGGEGGIRTHVERKPPTDFESVPL